MRPPVAPPASPEVLPPVTPTLVELRQAAVAARVGLGGPAVRGVNWAVAAGDFWAIGGLPGCGKSQLLETAAGLASPLQGTHALFGRTMTSLSSKEALALRQRVGFVFGDGGRLFHHLTVAQNLGLPLCYRLDCEGSAVADRVAAILALTGLTRWAHESPGRMNRTLCQRVALARALALQPEVLFLDNPLSGLDASQCRWWMEFLGRLRAGLVEGFPRALALVVATDDMRPWTRVALQFALIKEGQWLHLGGRGEVAMCAEPLWRELLAEGPADD